MEEINYILDDKSNNDKQLVKELSLYIKNHRDKRLKVNKKFITNIINIVLRNSEINYNAIDFKYKGIIGGWNFYEGVLVLNITGILNTSNEINREWFSSKIDKRTISYYWILNVIIHEVTHSRQDYVKKNKQNRLYDTCDRLVDEKYDVYNDNHDTVLSERYANLRGTTLAYEVLSYIYPEKYIKSLRDICFTYLMHGYGINNHGEEADDILTKNSQIISAIESYNTLLEENSIEKVNIESNDNMTLYDKLYLGLPITVDEMKKLSKLFMNLSEESGEVKKLINKL